MTGLVNTVKKVSDDIKIEFGLDKCAKAKFMSEQKIAAEGIQGNYKKVKQDLEPEATYNCLGMEDGNGSDHHKMKAKIQKEYKRRISLVLKSELNARNKIAAINKLAVPVVSYSYREINWKLDEIQDLDRITRKQLCMNQMLANKVDVDRIYLPYQAGGRELMNLEKEYKATMVGLYQYMANKEDVQISALLRHHTGKALYSVSKESTKYLAEAGTSEDIEDTQPLTATKKANEFKDKCKRDYKKMMKDRWSEKNDTWEIPKPPGKRIYRHTTFIPVDEAQWTQR